LNISEETIICQLDLLLVALVTVDAVYVSSFKKIYHDQTGILRETQLLIPLNLFYKKSKLLQEELKRFSPLAF